MFIMNISPRIFSRDAEESGGDISFPAFDSRCYFLRRFLIPERSKIFWDHSGALFENSFDLRYFLTRLLNRVTNWSRALPPEVIL